MIVGPLFGALDRLADFPSKAWLTKWKAAKVILVVPEDFSDQHIEFLWIDTAADWVREIRDVLPVRHGARAL